MKILTFIIPAYNSEQYLDKCIPSMLHPSVLDKLEIIIVNDGSTDNTAIVAEKYCSQYPDVVRLISQENKGHGGALNTGCAAATGKYLKVIDADDWVVTENLPEFLSLLESCESEVVLTHYHTVDISTKEVRDWKCSPKEFACGYTFEEIVAEWLSFKFNLTFHGITYQTKFYQKHKNNLPEHVFYEDYEYSTFPCCFAKSVMPLDLFLYEYRIGDVNQSVSHVNQVKRIGHVETVLHNMLHKYNQLPENAGKRYAAFKTQELLLSYYTTALLINPNKKAGRQLAATQTIKVQKAAPNIARAVEWKYQVYVLMNRLHISKSTRDKLMRSKIYKVLRKNYLFYR